MAQFGPAPHPVQRAAPEVNRFWRRQMWNKERARLYTHLSQVSHSTDSHQKALYLSNTHHDAARARALQLSSAQVAAANLGLYRRLLAVHGRRPKAYVTVRLQNPATHSRYLEHARVREDNARLVSRLLAARAAVGEAPLWAAHAQRHALMLARLAHNPRNCFVPDLRRLRREAREAMLKGAGAFGPAAAAAGASGGRGTPGDGSSSVPPPQQQRRSAVHKPDVVAESAAAPFDDDNDDDEEPSDEDVSDGEGAGSEEDADEDADEDGFTGRDAFYSHVGSQFQRRQKAAQRHQGRIAKGGRRSRPGRSQSALQQQQQRRIPIYTYPLPPSSIVAGSSAAGAASDAAPVRLPHGTHLVAPALLDASQFAALSAALAEADSAPSATSQPSSHRGPAQAQAQVQAQAQLYLRSPAHAHAHGSSSSNGPPHGASLLTLPMPPPSEESMYPGERVFLLRPHQHRPREHEAAVGDAATTPAAGAAAAAAAGGAAASSSAVCEAQPVPYPFPFPPLDSDAAAFGSSAVSAFEEKESLQPRQAQTSRGGSTRAPFPQPPLHPPPHSSRSRAHSRAPSFDPHPPSSARAATAATAPAAPAQAHPSHSRSASLASALSRQSSSSASRAPASERGSGSPGPHAATATAPSSDATSADPSSRFLRYFHDSSLRMLGAASPSHAHAHSPLPPLASVSRSSHHAASAAAGQAQSRAEQRASPSLPPVVSHSARQSAFSRSGASPRSARAGSSSTGGGSIHVSAGGVNHSVALRGGGVRPAPGATRRTQQQALDFMLDLVDG